MAEKVTILKTITDDLDGAEYDPDKGEGETVTFGWKGREYSIDLKSKHADEFAKAMERYVDHARRLARRPAVTASGSSHTDGSGRRRGGGQGMGRSKEELAEMRAWLRANGHEVADSGLVPKRLQEIYDARETAPQIPNTQASAAARAPGKAPAFSGAGDKQTPAPAKPLDSLIRPVSAQVPRGSDNR